MAAVYPELARFVDEHPAFTLDEFLEADRGSGRARATTIQILKAFQASETIASVRRGVYVAVESRLEHWLVAMKLAPDAVLAYEGAATFHDLHSLENSIEFLTAHKVRELYLDEVIFTAVSAADPRAEEHVQQVRREGHLYYVTTKERTLVDLLDDIVRHTDLARLWHAFKTAGRLDSATMLAYAKRLDRAVVYSRLGLLLESLGGHAEVTHKLSWLVSRSRQHFQRERPRQGDKEPWERDLGPDQFVRRWNIFVPHDFLLHLEGRLKL